MVSENHITRIDPLSDRNEASLFGCAVTTHFGGAENDANIKFGKSVFSVGGVSLDIIQAENLRSAYLIIAVDLYDRWLDLVKVGRIRNGEMAGRCLIRMDA